MCAKKALVEGFKESPVGTGDVRSWLFDELVALVGSFNVFGEHANAVSQIVFGLEGMLSLRSNAQRWEGRDFLIPAGLMHEFDLGPGRVLMIYLDPMHPFARALLGVGDLSRLLPSLSPEGLEAARLLGATPMGEEATQTCFAMLLGEWGAGFPPTPRLDQRIAQALQSS